MVAKNNSKKCLSCAGCVGICPSDAISLRQMKIVVDALACVDCGNCVRFCPLGAMILEKVGEK